MSTVGRSYDNLLKNRCVVTGGVLVTALAYLSLTRLNVLSVESQRWGLHEHQKHLAQLSIAEITVGSALALVALLGCVETLITKKVVRARREATVAMSDVLSRKMERRQQEGVEDRALDTVAGVIILAQIAVSLAALTLMVWVEKDIPPRRTNCRGCMEDLLFVVQRMIPTIAAFLFASALSQCFIIVINKVLTNREIVQAKIDRMNNLQSYKLSSVNMDEYRGKWAQRRPTSRSTNINFSGSLFHRSLAECPSVFDTPQGQQSKFQHEQIDVRMTLAPKKQPIKIVVTQPSDDVTRTLSRSWPSEDAPVPPDFSHYANIE
ncbi:uncharacterized protein LOC135368306 isoform X2 [Ornithodoros turicata]|uniref:uncharacterized protein LOC135368306 isoform X2 n=1 Tax=Ornithodoros turicata TaxID=34597 RepID=UPI003138662F